MKFLARSSDGITQYVMRAQGGPGRLTITCSCPAGDKGTHCRHRLELLSGILDDFASNNEEDLRTVFSWIPGSPLEGALAEMAAAEKELDSAKKRVKNAAKAVGRVLKQGV